MLKRLTAILCAGVMLAGVVSMPVFAKSSSEIQKELDEYNEELSDSQKESEKLTEQINDSKDKVTELVSEVESLNIEKEQYKQEMMLRIKYFYEESPENAVLEALLGADDFTDFVNRMEYMQTVYDYDTSQLDEYAALISESEEKEADLEDKIDELSDLLEEQEALQAKLADSISSKESELAEAKAAEAAAEASAVVYGSDGDSGGKLTRKKGVVYYNGHRETYYSQRVLPGGGLSIPGRHVADDGTIRDGDGYICVASEDLAYGSTVETTLGTAKVYDNGCSSGTVDIYTDW